MNRLTTIAISCPSCGQEVVAIACESTVRVGDGFIRIDAEYLARHDCERAEKVQSADG